MGGQNGVRTENDDSGGGGGTNREQCFRVRGEGVGQEQRTVLPGGGGGGWVGTNRE
jgi:hypothetical protein